MYIYIYVYMVTFYFEYHIYIYIQQVLSAFSRMLLIWFIFLEEIYFLAAFFSVLEYFKTF